MPVMISVLVFSLPQLNSYLLFASSGLDYQGAIITCFQDQKYLLCQEE